VLAFLSEYLLWWHWIALGLILITLELFVGTFMLLGLGVAAMIVGEVDNIFQTSLTTELILWMVLSLLSLWLWFTYLRDQHPLERVGQSDQALDTQGTVKETITPTHRGKVRFDTPVLGNTTWHVTAKESIPVGSRVKIVNIKGQLIEVAKLS